MNIQQENYDRIIPFLGVGDDVFLVHAKCCRDGSIDVKERYIRP